MKQAVVVCSGGMDSTTLVAWYLNRGYNPLVLSVDYGQRHARELESAAEVASYYQLEWILVDATKIGELLTGSALTDTVDVPEGHYTADTMTATVVPNRNAILANIAVGVAVARKAPVVALGVHAGDHAVYPDCTPAFVATLNDMVRAATRGLYTPVVEAPFVHITKAEIAAHGHMLGAPLHLSWSCYKGGDQHCGRCGTCVERAEAFHLAGIADPTTYVDRVFWKTVTT